MKLAIFPLLSSFLCCLLFGYAFLLLPPVLLAPSRIENFKVHQKDDMTAVVIPRENWMLLFFFSATLEKKCCIFFWCHAWDAFEAPAENSSIMWLWHEFNAMVFLSWIHSELSHFAFLLQYITNWIWSRQCEKSVWLQEKIQSLWKSPLSPHLLSSCSARTQKH